MCIRDRKAPSYKNFFKVENMKCSEMFNKLKYERSDDEADDKHVVDIEGDEHLNESEYQRKPPRKKECTNRLPSSYR